MLCKKTDKFWKTGFITISMMIVLSISGCSDVSIEETEIIETESEVPIPVRSDPEEAEKVIEICFDLYAKAAEEKRTWDDLGTVRGIVNRLGENGYTAVDSQNQIDMTCIAQIEDFCRKVDEKADAEFTMIEVTYWGGFSIYHFRTEEGTVYVAKSYYEYEDGQIEEIATGSYVASSWNYTEDGYLMFSGNWFSETLYILTLSEAEEYIAFRVQPLNETCRELNRKYLQPIGYERNNMFLVDWSEKDFGDLDFYDLYDILYSLINAKFVPYTADDNLSVDTVYRIQKEDFERVIMTYFHIDSEALQAKTIYYPEETAYEYRPRGFYEAEYPEWPYSEVVAFTENDDRTISLTVNVVFPYAGISKVYAHEVVVRPLENGGVQYVSNHIIPSEDNYEVTWHTPRLTAEEWEKMYGDYE